MDIDQLLLTIAYFLEYVIKNLMLPGQIERWVVVEDMKGMSLTSIPFGVRKHFYCQCVKRIDPQKDSQLPSKQLQIKIVQVVYYE